MKSLKKILGLLSLFLILPSCTTTKTALYDQYSYQKTTEIKVTSLQLISNATTTYSLHKMDADKLLLEIDKQIEYEKNKPDNEITYAMWQLVRDDEKNVLGGFIKRWSEKGSFSPIFVDEAKKQVSSAFDVLIQYEVKKDKQSKDVLQELLSKTN